MPVDRITQRFAALKAEGRSGLVTFIMAGDPDINGSLEMFKQLPAAGADMIELGMPFSDPMADGPVIQEAGIRALKVGTTLPAILEMVQAFRMKDHDTPIILMGYYNPIYRYGPERFAKDAAAAGVDGLIVVDLPYEEEAELRIHTDAHDIAMVRLIAPTTDDNRLPTLLKNAQGFVYAIAVAGITGDKSADTDALNTQLARIRAHTDLPIVAGFGIKTPQHAAATGQYADAAVVGSAIVERIATHPHSTDTAIAFVRSLADALRA